MIVSSRRWVVLALLLSVNAAIAAEQEREPLTVFAAASLTDALQKVSDAYTKSSGTPVRLSFAASSALAKQIESGARADVFFSADQEWMDYLDGKQLLKPASRRDLLGNRLALIAPRDSKVSLKLAPNAPVAAALGRNGRLATGDPDSVPAGKYAKAALTTLHLWDTLQSRLARAENVRVAMAYVARGEAPLGIVYSTDAAVEPRVRVVDVFPESSHPPITYPVALLKEAKPAASSFAEFLRGRQAQAIFVAAGFTFLPASSTAANACTGFQFDVTRELQLFAGTPRQITAGTTRKAAPVIEGNQLYEAALADQAKTRFAIAPDKATVNDGSYAGLIAVAAGPAKTLRVTSNQPLWIDLIDGDRVIDSTRHTGSHGCPLIRKSVEFQVRPDRALLLQLSGSTARNVRVSITN